MALKLQNEVYCEIKNNTGNDEMVFPLDSTFVRYTLALVYVFVSFIDISYIMTEIVQLNGLMDRNTNTH